jgi:FKBP-type peptidyl-prolyl cis-trans isomerase SlyD
LYSGTRDLIHATAGANGHIFLIVQTSTVHDAPAAHAPFCDICGCPGGTTRSKVRRCASRGASQYAQKDLPMQIDNQKVVSIDYTLTGPDGKVLDSSSGKEPLVYMHGVGNIIPGLERQLQGKATGDNIKVTIAAADAYGERNEQLVQPVPRQAFQGVQDIRPGMQFQARGPDGQTAMVTVRKVDPNEITIDANHPLAGVPLTFDVTVMDVRDSTAEEREHGHAHGPGGHQH